MSINDFSFRFGFRENVPTVPRFSITAELAPNFLEEIVKAFDDSSVGAVTGKTIREFEGEKGIVDGTGIIVDRFRRGRDRGQNEIDTGQYAPHETLSR